MKRSWVRGLLGVLGVVVILEVLARTQLISEHYFPPVTEMLAALVERAATPELWADIAGTMRGWAIGLALAVLIGVPLGLLIGSNPYLFRALRVPIEFLRPIPSVALIPLAVLVYGTGLESKVFLVTFACTWPMLVQTLYGVRDVDPVAMDTARSFRLTRLERLTRITLPSAMPYIVTGLRVSAAIALILAVTAELVFGSAGLGNAISAARLGGAVELTYALIIVTGLLGLAVNAVFVRGERRVLRWHPSHRPNEVGA